MMYYTLDEWIEAFAKGLRGSLELSFGNDSQHHQEDLATSSAVYAENIFQFAAGHSGLRREKK